MNISKPKLLNNWAIYPRAYILDHPYWFCYTMENEKSTTEIRYKVLIRHYRDESDETSLYLIHRISDVYINGKLPELCLEELAYETGKVFYPMLIEIDKKAKWVSLRNYNQIKNKWYSTVRPYVELRFGGAVCEEYLAKMDKVIDRKERIEDIFRNELLFKFFFGTFYHGYSQKFEINRILEFPEKGNSTTMYNVKCKLNRNLTDEGYKEITQNGVSITKILTEKDVIIEDGQTVYSAKIHLYTKSNYLRQADAEWDFVNDRRKIILKIYPVRRKYEEEIDLKIDKKENNNNSLFSKLFGE